MRRIVVLVLTAAMLGGCSARLGVQIGNIGKSATVPTVGPGGSFSSSGVSLEFGNAPGVASLLGAVGLGWLVGRDAAAGRFEEAPALDPSRTVNQQDCRQPVEGTGNLNCN